MKKWKIIFWIYAVLFALQIIQIPMRSNHTIYDVIGLLITGFTLMPLYGFAYKIAIGSRAIAITIFAINLILLIGATYFAILYTLENLSIIQLFFTLLAMLIVSMFFYPIYAYAFSSKDIWSKNA